MQVLSIEPGTAEEVPAEEAAEELFDLAIDVEPYLPDSVVPIWVFLQDFPVLLVVLMLILGYLVGKGLQWIFRTVLTQAAKEPGPTWMTWLLTISPHHCFRQR